MSFPLPTPLLKRICVSDGEPTAIAMCPDFEFGRWRYAKLAAHLFDWLPDVALKPEERKAMLYEPRKTLAAAARRLFDVTDPESRGEVGEILIHAISRQEFNTLPFCARLFYKMRSNDTVTSVDMAHVLYHADTDKLELWLGEAKLYKNLDDAKSRALKSIAPLWEADFLSEMKALIGPKIESGYNVPEKLIWLFADETSLDHIVDSLVIPICVAADFDATKGAGTRTAAYLSEIQDELDKLRDYFQQRVPTHVKIVCMFVPMDCKDDLQTAVNDTVQALL